MLCVALLVACAPRHRSAIEGVLVVDEEVALVRGERIDGAQRDFPVDANATFVAMVDEDDIDVKVSPVAREGRRASPGDDRNRLQHG